MKNLKLKLLQRKIHNLSFEEQVKFLRELSKHGQAKDYGKSPDGRYHLFIVSNTIAIFVDYHERNFKVIDKRTNPSAFQKVLESIG